MGEDIRDRHPLGGVRVQHGRDEVLELVRELDMTFDCVSCFYAFPEFTSFVLEEVVIVWIVFSSA